MKRELPPTLPVLYRDAEIESTIRADGEDEKKYRVSISSDKPVRRWFGFETLSHDAKHIDTSYMKKGLPLLDSHDARLQIGIIDNPEIVGSRIVGDARFSRNARAQEVRADVEDKIKRSTSVGYMVQKYRLVETDTDGVDHWEAVRWTPLEGSVVAVPADITVGFGRDAVQNGKLFPVEFEGGEPREVRAMDPETTITPTAPAAPAATPAVRVEVGNDYRSDDADQILAMCERHGHSDKARDMIKRKLAPQAAAAEILEMIRTPVRGTPGSEQLDGLSKRDLSKFSYARAISQQLTKGKSGNFDGLEGEIHRELLKNGRGGMEDHGGILVPMRLQERTLDSLTAGKGAETVFEQQGEMIDILRNRAMVLAMGGQLMTDLVGPVTFPKQTGAMTVYWVPENPASGVTSSDIAFGQVTISPKTMMGTTALSRQLLAQSSIGNEALVRADIGSGHGLAIDLAALHGPGTDGQPMGIYNTPGVLTQAIGGVPAYGPLVDMTSKVADANALMNSMGWMTTPLLAGKMRQVAEHATAQMAGWLWVGTVLDGTVAGYKAVATNQVSKTLGAGAEHGLIFGDWSTVMVALWGAMELVVDPYTSKNKALIELTSYQQGDVALRYPQAMCVGTGATLS